MAEALATAICAGPSLRRAVCCLEVERWRQNPENSSKDLSDLNCHVCDDFWPLDSRKDWKRDQYPPLAFDDCRPPFLGRGMSVEDR